MRILAALALVALAAAAGTAAVPQETPPDSDTFTELDGIDLGEQVWGPKISRYDLAGKVVVCYHWCITCPLSTGAFPYVKQLCEKYRDRGVAFIGFQVKRPVALRRNNVVWYLEHLRPNFPVVRRGWVREWPVKYLPWAVVYDHTGKEIFADNLPNLQKTLDAALAKAPDWMIGGPYVKLAETAAAMKRDRNQLGKHLAKVRALADIADADTTTRTEANAVLAAVGRYHRRQLAKAEEDLASPVDQAALYGRLARRFDGDELAVAARTKAEAITHDASYPAEVRAWRALAAAGRAIRRLPPAANYTYNMDLRPIKDRAHRMQRATIIAAYQLALEQIARHFPNTHAAGEAESMAVDFEVPELSKEDVTLGMKDFEARFAAAKSPYSSYEAVVLLHALNEGYYGDDELAEQIDARLEAVKSEKNAALDKAAGAYQRANDEADRLSREIRDGGEALSRKKADEHIAALRKIANKAGAESGLAKRITNAIERLEQSFTGPASLGVAFDTRFEGPGVRVYHVRPASAGHHAGLRRGDVVLKIGETAIEGVKPFRELLKAMKPGQETTVTIRRAGADKTETLPTVLGRRLGRRR